MRYVISLSLFPGDNISLRCQRWKLKQTTTHIRILSLETYISRERRLSRYN
jgi:hypothetical protein